MYVIGTFLTMFFFLRISSFSFSKKLLSSRFIPLINLPKPKKKQLDIEEKNRNHGNFLVFFWKEKPSILEEKNIIF